MVVLLPWSVTCKSSKQETLFDSTTEVEYIAASEATKEGTWIRKFFIELGVFPNGSSPLDLYCDNNVAIAQVITIRATRYAVISSYSRVRRKGWDQDM